MPVGRYALHHSIGGVPAPISLEVLFYWAWPVTCDRLQQGRIRHRLAGGAVNGADHPVPQTAVIILPALLLTDIIALWRSPAPRPSSAIKGGHRRPPGAAGRVTPALPEIILSLK
jgi:hypothetical protein